ncbi:SSNA1 protein, partial [Glaucidium brasilianum]|nr:SSNA1 protein [Glaucidium brasilianum]
GLAELRARREELSERIRAAEAERGRLQSRIAALSERLARTSESPAGHLVARGELDRTIAETEAAYGKILESSQTLLDVLKGKIENAGEASDPRSTSKEKQTRGQKHS